MAITELHVALTSEMEERMHQMLFPSDRKMPERGIIGLAHLSKGRRRVTVLLREILDPLEGEVSWDWDQGLLFSTAYKSRALDAASAEGAGLIIMHTHPHHEGTRTAPTPSLQDLESDRRDLFHMGQGLPEGAPLAAGILGENGLWSARLYQFSFPTRVEHVGRAPHRSEDGLMTRTTAVRVVGERLRKLPTEVACEGPAGASAAIDLEAHDSSVRLWGEEGQAVLASVRVGQTGLGGVGGILAEHVARLGIGADVMIDYDRIQRANLNRSQGATREDARVGRLKVDVGARLAREAATAPNFEVTSIEGSVVEAAAMPDLLDCDLILNAADSPWARQVLDDLAYAHLIPVINGGTDLYANEAGGQVRWGKSDVNVAGPGHPCLECQGAYTRARVTEAQEHPTLRGERGYLVAGDQASAQQARGPSVISNNALVAALMELRLQALVLGTTPGAARGTQRYYPLEGIIDWAAIPRCKATCVRAEEVARGDACILPTGVDLDFRVAREEWQALNGATGTKGSIERRRAALGVPGAGHRRSALRRWASAVFGWVGLGAGRKRD